MSDLVEPVSYRLPYGVRSPWLMSRCELELYCFETGRTVEQGGLGKYEHFRKATKWMFPSLQWNSWLEQQIESLCSDENVVTLSGVVADDSTTTNTPRTSTGVGQQLSNISTESVSTVRTVVWTGCATAGKTFAAGLYATVWWSAAPDESIVILTSTTKDMIRRRIWPVIQDLCHSAACPVTKQHIPLGHLIDSQTKLLLTKGDDKHAIVAMAVAHGETQKAVHNLKGVHLPRILLVIDEANGTPEAILQTIPNLRKSCRDFTCLIIGNPVSRLDVHGRACEPATGWGSVSVSDEKWRTRGVRDWHLEPGTCLHFDGFRSPNVLAGRTVYPYLYTVEDYQTARSHPADSLATWSQDRGFWAPEGTLHTVLTEVMVMKYEPEKPFIFISKAIPVAALDPAFGGNQCVLQFGLVGDTVEQESVLQLTDTVIIEPIADSVDEIEFQIAQRVMRECADRNILPEHFGTDSTGTGRGVAAVLAQHWSTAIHKVEFGGSATEEPASVSDTRPANEVYANRVTELWFRVRELLVNKQLQGLNREALVEFCSREYTYRSKRLLLASKDECRAALGGSPDHADAIAVLVETARRAGLTLSATLSTHQSTTWTDFVQDAHSVYEDTTL